MRYSPGFNRDYYGGALMVLIGLAAVYAGLGYHLGTLARLGPGFFPVLIGGLLAATGVAIAASASPVRESGDKLAPEWRGWLCIVGGLLAFVVLGIYGGLIPGTFALVFITAMGDRKNTVKSAALLALAMVVIAIVLFRWALQLQLPLFSWG